MSKIATIAQLPENKNAYNGAIDSYIQPKINEAGKSMSPVMRLNQPKAVPAEPWGAISATKAFSTPSAAALNIP
jgi:hypothetical protein